MKNKRIYQLWLKQYLKNNRNMDFYEIRYLKGHTLINKKDFNIRGSHTSSGAYDAENDIKAVYEYIERIMCLDLPENSIIKKENDMDCLRNTMLSLEDLGFAWTGNVFKNLSENPAYVKATGIKKGKKYLIPAAFVYYLSDEYKKWEGFSGNSNGTALGDNFLQAYEAALLEFVERDKFIKYWFLNEGKIWRIKDVMLSPELKERAGYFKEIGYDVDFFYLDNRPKEITVVWCLLRSNNESNSMFSISGLGTDIDLKIAADKAFEEVSGIFFSRRDDEKLLEKIRESKGREKNFGLEEGLYYYFSYERKKELEELLKDISVLKSYPATVEESLNTIALKEYDDILYTEIDNKILKDLGLCGIKVFGLGGHSLYFSYNQEVMNCGRIEGPCPFA